LAAPKGNKFSTGRTPGSKNQRTIEWEELGKVLLSSGADRAARIMAEAQDDDYMKYYMQLVEYFAPKQSRVEAINKNDTQVSINVNWDGQNFIHTTPKASLQSGEGPERS
jgi:hypothetical protein